jgi:aminopeptidase-like protein
MLRYSDLVATHYRKNRTIVSRDIEPILRDVEALIGLPLTLHRFPTGADYGTWVVPPRWDVREAWLKDPDGAVVASYREHPLFLAPYSKPFSGRLTFAELKPHLRHHPTQANAFFYEHRLAYDFRRRLNEWIITVPGERMATARDGFYQVHIDVDVAAGEMLVGDIAIAGKSGDTIALLTDYCHPGQVNDSFSGILAMIDVMRDLAAGAQPHHTIRLFMFCETFGSVALLQSRPDYARSIKLAIFSEFVGWGRNWRVTARKDPALLSCQLAAEATRTFAHVQHDPLFTGFGNDEIVFDYAQIPSMSVQMNECDEYHGSNDHPDRLDQGNLDFARDLILHLVRVADRNEVLQFDQIVPIYQSRFGLYVDSFDRRKEFLAQRAIMYGIRDRKALLEIANQCDVPFAVVRALADRLVNLKLALGRP